MPHEVTSKIWQEDGNWMAMVKSNAEDEETGEGYYWRSSQNSVKLRTFDSEAEAEEWAEQAKKLAHVSPPILLLRKPGFVAGMRGKLKSLRP